MITPIKVTQNHIDQGCRHDQTACPIARAVTEVVSLTTIVRVFSYCVTLRHSPFSTKIPTTPVSIPHSQEMRDWITAYDVEGPEAVRPTVFNVNIPEEYLA